MKINIIRTVDSQLSETQNGISRNELNRLYRLAGLYEIESKPVIQIVRGGKHVRYMIKK